MATSCHGWGSLGLLTVHLLPFRCLGSPSLWTSAKHDSTPPFLLLPLSFPSLVGRHSQEPSRCPAWEHQRRRSHPTPGGCPPLFHPLAPPCQPGRSQPLLQDQKVETGNQSAGLQSGHTRWATDPQAECLRRVEKVNFAHAFQPQY